MQVMNVPMHFDQPAKNGKFKVEQNAQLILDLMM